MPARQRAGLGQQLGALVDLPREGWVALVGQVRRQVVGQPVAADLPLGQVDQHLAHQQQADAQVRRVLGPPPIARAQAGLAQDPHRHAQPDHDAPLYTIAVPL